jgi:hypothetical protein
MSVRVSHVLIGFALAASLAMSGCSTIKKFTGQRDDTVLQGAREDVLPTQKIQAPEPDPVQPKKCQPLDTKCLDAQQGADGTVQ